jgi:6-phosphofructokinase 2
MADVVTLTMNPSIDLSVSVERVMPFHKLRCAAGRRDPGGGGINVARVMKRLGADVTAIYPAGGTLGLLLRRLVDQEGIPALTPPITGETREDFTVLEQSTGAQYRFVLPGPHFAEQEWHICLNMFGALDSRTRFVVGSGSLPPGVPDDFYGRIARLARQTSRKIVIDSSGPALRAALEAGVYLIKPSLNEFRGLLGRDQLETEAEWIRACQGLVERGQVEVVALTLGDRGALLVTRDRVLRAQALAIKPVSVVGAGDSFLGAVMWSLAAGHTMETAFRYGVAAGSAALLMPGTELCQREDVERLVNDVRVQMI